MLAIDCETTGIDWAHGTKPFFVVTCSETGEQKYWEWDVDPLTRMPEIPEGDVDEIGEYLFASGPNGPIGDTSVDPEAGFIFHNSKFDFSALQSIGLWDRYSVYDVWRDVRDTLVASHLLASNQLKDLTTLTMRWMEVDISSYEDRLEEAVKDCRRKVQQAKLKERRLLENASKVYKLADETPVEPDPLASWRIGSEDDPMLPSSKGEGWRADYWLPRAYALHAGLPEGHGYYTVLRDYALQDAPATLACWRLMREQIVERGLMRIFEERMKVLPVTYRMEQRGVTLSGERLEELRGQYREESQEAGDLCLGIAESMGYELKLPKGASPNNSIREFCYDVLKLPPIVAHKSKTGNPSLDKNAIAEYLTTLKGGTKALSFLKTWIGKRKRDTSLGFMDSYEKFWVPTERSGYYLLHPNLNPCGTDTLRFSCNNPNTQQISKQETICSECEGEGCKECRGTGKSFRSMKYIFGPEPGREWYSFDAKGIEDRLPAYLSGEQELIDIFESSEKPPYYGSNHLLRFHTVYDDIWNIELRNVGVETVGPHCKKKYASTNYQWAKNGGFAVQYGAIEKRDGWGTADRAFHKQWSHRKLKERFSKLEALNQQCIELANRQGYVETIPDQTLEGSCGYPIACTKTNRGTVLETVPLNYVIQSSAMWWTQKAMVRVTEFFEFLNEGGKFMGKLWPGGYYLVLQVHDEIVTDMPADRIKTHHYNWPIVQEVRRLMELGGLDYGIPTPVGCEHHRSNWAEGKTL